MADATGSDDDDARLSAAVRDGDLSTFESVLRAHGARLLATARHLLGDEADARQAVHDAAVTAFQSPDTLGADEAVVTWLHRLTANAALQQRRQQDPGRADEEPVEDLVPRFLPTGVHVETFDAWRDLPADGPDRARMTAAVREAIDRLPPPYRLVLLLRDVEGVGRREVASILGIPPNAVKIRLHQARLGLRTLLAPHFTDASS
jgi:RNA polymerase sigma-70 factor (ECF subfamily)